MTRTLSIMTLIVTSLFAGFAQADANEVAERCIAQIREMADRSVDAIHTTTANGVERIQRLADEGAPDEALVRSARHSIRRIHTIARSSSAHIGRLVHACVRELRDMGAPDELVEAVVMAGRHARGRIGTAAENGTRAVRRALHEAIGG
jgi:hypothetical protein